MSDKISNFMVKIGNNFYDGYYLFDIDVFAVAVADHYRNYRGEISFEKIEEQFREAILNGFQSYVTTQTLIDICGEKAEIIGDNGEVVKQIDLVALSYQVLLKFDNKRCPIATILRSWNIPGRFYFIIHNLETVKKYSEYCEIVYYDWIDVRTLVKIKSDEDFMMLKMQIDNIFPLEEYDDLVHSVEDLLEKMKKSGHDVDFLLASQREELEECWK